jgi:hypothetical protein
LGPANADEADLCRRAGELDWLYLSTMVLADAGTIALDSAVLQASGHAGVRMLGPGLVGLSWGWSVGGTYLTLPQCSPGYAGSLPPEGQSRSHLPLAVSFSVLAAAMAPVIVGVETGEGQETLQWSTTERVMRLVVASATGVVGSVMPYVLPPRTWRAMRKLDNLRAGVTAQGALFSYTVSF